MAIIRKSLDEIVASKPAIDKEKIRSFSEEDIQRMAVEDGEVPDDELAVHAPSPKTLRLRHGMTQEQFASALRIPIATLRNWEQGRTEPDPAARALLTVLAKNPKAVFEALTEPAAH